MRKYIKKIWHLLPDRIKFYTKQILSFLIFIKRFLYIDSKKLRDAREALRLCNAPQKYILMGKPEYGNIGDLAIAYFTKEFACRVGVKDYYIEIPEDVIIFFHNQLGKYISENDVLILQGGGNLGDKYRDQEFIRKRVCRKFYKNKIILMPQSVDYGKTKHGANALRSAKKAFNKVSNMTIFARDYQSFLTMKQIFGEKNIFLVPDIVLSCVPFDLHMERQYVYVCLRNDCESVLDGDFKNNIVNICKKFDKVIIGDNVISSGFDKNSIVRETLEKISSYKLVVTDRLHVMIFSVITETPCIVIDNSNHKIAASYDWIKKYTGYQIVKDKFEIDEAIHRLLCEKINNPTLDKEYADLERLWRNA